MTKPAEIRQAVGIDFGGTSVKLAVVDETGQIKARARFATEEANGVANWIDLVAQLLDTMLTDEVKAAGPLAGIGVGVPGFVDYERGFVYNLTNVPGWRAVELAPTLEKRFNLRARVDNDVNVMALGECTFGAGRAYQNAVFVTLGTGVGGGLLINNKIYRGAYSMAGEIGHISIDMNGIQAPTGKGGVEQYVGNRRIVERALKQIQEGRKSIIMDLAKGDMRAVTPELIAQAAQQDDQLALETFDFVADCLATMFASVSYLIQPQAFIVGGGVAQSGPILFDPLRKHVDERLISYFSERLVIKTAELGNDAGVIGAATLLFKE